MDNNYLLRAREYSLNEESLSEERIRIGETHKEGFYGGDTDLTEETERLVNILTRDFEFI